MSEASFLGVNDIKSVLSDADLIISIHAFITTKLNSCTVLLGAVHNDFLES